jgi:hypothetical protein
MIKLHIGVTVYNLQQLIGAFLYIYTIYKDRIPYIGLTSYVSS